MQKQEKRKGRQHQFWFYLEWWKKWRKWGKQTNASWSLSYKSEIQNCHSTRRGPPCHISCLLRLLYLYKADSICRYVYTHTHLQPFPFGRGKNKWKKGEVSLLPGQTLKSHPIWSVRNAAEECELFILYGLSYIAFPALYRCIEG